jgi:hypothetical protein
LLDQIPGPLASFIGDGAYDHAGIYSTVGKCHPDADVIVPPRLTAVLSEDVAATPTQRDRHLQSIAEHGRMGWQKQSGYTRRALVEAAISRIKRVIGDGLRSRTEPRRATEVAIGIDAVLGWAQGPPQPGVQPPRGTHAIELADHGIHESLPFEIAPQPTASYYEFACLTAGMRTLPALVGSRHPPGLKRSLRLHHLIADQDRSRMSTREAALHGVPGPWTEAPALPGEGPVGDVFTQPCAPGAVVQSSVRSR